MIQEETELYGRRINRNMIAPSLLSHSQLIEQSSMEISGAKVQCHRCGQLTAQCEASLPHSQFYCPQCINLGRVSTLQSLCSIPEPNRFNANDKPLTWNGQLTSSQQGCAKQLIERLKQHQDHLLCAVTGAGKTEMLFPGLEYGIKRGWRIAIASPRVDVCIELMPRIKAAFANTSLVLLHGKQERPYQYAQLTICTTHQLLRFYHAFDMLIIDEVDSFPYANHPGLHYAVQNAVKTSGSRVYLTATPDHDLLSRVRQQKLSISYLPLRFHRHLLPMIKVHQVITWRHQLKKGRLPRRLVKMMQDKLNQQLRWLLFVPHIQDLNKVDGALKQQLTAKWATVYSADPQRLTKVQAMRDGKLDFLITTTILERGVTFPGIDVIVLGADDAVFSTAALVQIAGRVGRKTARPTGDVDYFVAANNQRVHQARHQIKQMNRLGARLKNE